jgi:hypothetical protein
MAGSSFPRTPVTADPFTLQERMKPVVLAVLLSLLGAALLAVTNGNLLVIPAFCGALAFLFLLTRYLELGIYIMLGASLLLEQFQIFGITDIVTQKIPFFLNLNLITGIGALVFNPVEVMMGLMFGLWFLRAVTSREWHLYPIPNFGIAVVFLGMLIFFTGYGLARGGDWKASLWEIRALYYLCIMYFLTSQIIRDHQQVRVCIWIILVMIAIKGLQGFWRYVVTLQGDLTGIRAITGHEDALFISSVFVLMASFYFLNYRGPEVKFSLAFLPTTFFTFLLAQRRIVYGTLGFSLFVVVAMLPREKKIIAAKAMAPVLVLLVIYVAAFWNSGSKLGMPVQKIKSVFVEQKGTEDESSNFYRKAELVNLKQTIRHNPMGIGFGNKYEIVMPLDKVDFPLWEYIPHNCIYWMWVKTGFGGFIIFWLFFGTAIAQAVIDYRNMKDPYFKSVALMVLSLVASQVIIAYYDLQITFFRNMIYLGIAMAIATAIRRIEADIPTEQGGDPGA